MSVSFNERHKQLSHLYCEDHFIFSMKDSLINSAKKDAALKSTRCGSIPESDEPSNVPIFFYTHLTSLCTLGNMQVCRKCLGRAVYESIDT